MHHLLKPGLIFNHQDWLKGQGNVQYTALELGGYSEGCLHPTRSSTALPSIFEASLTAWRRSICKWRPWLGQCNFSVTFTQPGSSCIARGGCCQEALLWICVVSLLQCEPISGCITALLLPVVKICPLFLLVVILGRLSNMQRKVRGGKWSSCLRDVETEACLQVFSPKPPASMGQYLRPGSDTWVSNTDLIKCSSIEANAC